MSFGQLTIRRDQGRDRRAYPRLLAMADKLLLSKISRPLQGSI
jgi:hypothetical protein